jgi:hypothetical protein
MLGTIGLFAPPNWPRLVLRKFGLQKSVGEESYAAVARRARLGDSAVSAQENPVSGNGSPSEDRIEQHKRAKGVPLASVSILLMLHVYVVLQLLVPLRHFLYPGDSTWTEEGHRFSWQMMLRIKNPLFFAVRTMDPSTHALSKVDLSSFLNPKQIDALQTRPDMIIQFAHYIADEQQRRSGIRPIVNVKAVETLNLREPQDLIDPRVDLSAQPEGQIPAPWIVPLKSTTGQTK